MPWNLLILPLVGGYFILTKCYIFKFHQQRLDRQRLIFESVLLGIALIVSTYLIRIFFVKLTPDLIDIVHSYSPFKQPFALTSLISVGIAIFFTIIYNKFSEDKKWIRKAIDDVGNEFESLMKYSFDEESLLQFTLNNDKIYIAWVKELPIPSISPYVRIIPAISGYRKGDKKQVEFTTHYLSVYASYIKEGVVKYVDDLNTDLILDISDITTVSNFDPEMYKKFQEQLSSE
ncbi:conserved membrane hypothetical protein [Tenacibaculum maritimum]|uniref:hypothetical protein n=1 Tax=Tenacibaculum maritimum TaxID=107401 RepID=UPI0012E694D1|nr:hypothetical protein [Tenacibaculum maritimum]CAA0189883.1 conserved membrane hypothetical protein [Tenacibaculum maritimum]